ncbi:MAG TPA: NAD-dependent epimerase/dehydratase family protein [Acidimicrobiia bacterium]|nr:NAD-dependent epimerase/dehydratase family protein [Acidimicrobiia bacterium]
MKVLVTGATGVYGRDLTDRLVRAGHEVVAMARRVPAALPVGVRFHQGDVSDGDAVEAAMAGCDVTAHLAWVVTPLKSEADTRRINVGGTENVLAAMARTGCRRLVFSSSVLCYGANPDNPPRFTETDERRPAPDYLYGSHKKEVEDLILARGVDAVLARTAATVGRNIDNLLLDIFAAPAIIGVKGADIRYQLAHQDDVGRFLALACEGGPSGPVNVAPDDVMPLAEIARLLGKRYVELSHQQVMAAVRFMWKHNLADITPGEGAAISYLPKVDTTRLRDVWGFHCAWTTAESVVDLRRAVAGRVVVAKRRIELPWRLRFPQGHTGGVSAVEHSATDRPAALDPPGGLDTPADRREPTYRAALSGPGPLRPLALTLHLDLLRTAAIGVINAFGTVRPSLAANAAGSFGHRLYLNEGLLDELGSATPLRRRLVAAGYAREVDRLAAAAGAALRWAADPQRLPDERLEAALAVLHDEAAWAWSVAATGAALDGALDGAFDALAIRSLDASPFDRGTVTGALPPDGRQRSWRAFAERTAAGLAGALVDAVGERAHRLAGAGIVEHPNDVVDLTWTELLQPPAPDLLAALIERRKLDHDRLRAVTLPMTLSGAGPCPLVSTQMATPAPRSTP